MKRRTALLLLLLMVFFVGLSKDIAYADEHANKIESVFLYNFLNYITWPGYNTPEEMKNATICIASNDPVQPYLEYIQQKRLEERKFTIRVLDDETSITGCQLFFIRDVGDEILEKLQRSAIQNNVLLISTKPNFIDNGGMIGLSPEGNRIAIDIDNSQLKQLGFQTSSRLLDLARKVK